MQFHQPPQYSDEDLRKQAETAREAFISRRRTMEQQCADFYNQVFDKASEDVQRVLEETNHLRCLNERADLLTESGILDLLRYMQRPTVSQDDFKILSGTGTAAPSRFVDPETAQNAVEYINRTINQKIFPWLEDAERGPHAAELSAAKTAVAALIADQKTKTLMRTSPSRSQEDQVRNLLQSHGYATVPARTIEVHLQFPKPMELFSREASVGSAKADIVAGLPDGRLLLLECKVSNSEVNSFKRLNHEVTDKTEKWRRAYGESVLCGCVLQGVFKTENLIAAQREGVAIFWSDNLTPLGTFIEDLKRLSAT